MEANLATTAMTMQRFLLHPIESLVTEITKINKMQLDSLMQDFLEEISFNGQVVYRPKSLKLTFPIFNDMGAKTGYSRMTIPYFALNKPKGLKVTNFEVEVGLSVSTDTKTNSEYKSQSQSNYDFNYNSSDGNYNANYDSKRESNQNFVVSTDTTSSGKYEIKLSATQDTRFEENLRNIQDRVSKLITPSKTPLHWFYATSQIFHALLFDDDFGIPLAFKSGIDVRNLDTSLFQNIAFNLLTGCPPGKEAEAQPDSQNRAPKINNTFIEKLLEIVRKTGKSEPDPGSGQRGRKYMVLSNPSAPNTEIIIYESDITYLYDISTKELVLMYVCVEKLSDNEIDNTDGSRLEDQAYLMQRWFCQINPDNYKASSKKRLRTENIADRNTPLRILAILKLAFLFAYCPNVNGDWHVPQTKGTYAGYSLPFNGNTAGYDIDKIDSGAAIITNSEIWKYLLQLSPKPTQVSILADPSLGTSQDRTMIGSIQQEVGEKYGIEVSEDVWKFLENGDLVTILPGDGKTPSSNWPVIAGKTAEINEQFYLIKWAADAFKPPNTTKKLGNYKISLAKSKYDAQIAQPVSINVTSSSSIFKFRIILSKTNAALTNRTLARHGVMAGTPVSGLNISMNTFFPTINWYSMNNNWMTPFVQNLVNYFGAGLSTQNRTNQYILRFTNQGLAKYQRVETDGTLIDVPDNKLVLSAAGATQIKFMPQKIFTGAGSINNFYAQLNVSWGNNSVAIPIGDNIDGIKEGMRVLEGEQTSISSGKIIQDNTIITKLINKNDATQMGEWLDWLEENFHGTIPTGKTIQDYNWIILNKSIIADLSNTVALKVDGGYWVIPALARQARPNGEKYNGPSIKLGTGSVENIKVMGQFIRPLVKYDGYSTNEYLVERVSDTIDYQMAYGEAGKPLAIGATTKSLDAYVRLKLNTDGTVSNDSILVTYGGANYKEGEILKITDGSGNGSQIQFTIKTGATLLGAPFVVGARNVSGYGVDYLNKNQKTIMQEDKMFMSIIKNNYTTYDLIPNTNENIDYLAEQLLDEYAGAPYGLNANRYNTKIQDYTTEATATFVASYMPNYGIPRIQIALKDINGSFNANNSLFIPNHQTYQGSILSVKSVNLAGSFIEVYEIPLGLRMGQSIAKFVPGNIVKMYYPSDKVNQGERIIIKEVDTALRRIYLMNEKGETAQDKVSLVQAGNAVINASTATKTSYIAIGAESLILKSDTKGIPIRSVANQQSAVSSIAVGQAYALASLKGRQLTGPNVPNGTMIVDVLETGSDQSYTISKNNDIMAVNDNKKYVFGKKITLNIAGGTHFGNKRDIRFSFSSQADSTESNFIAHGTTADGRTSIKYFSDDDTPLSFDDFKKEDNKDNAQKIQIIISDNNFDSSGNLQSKLYYYNTKPASSTQTAADGFIALNSQYSILLGKDYKLSDSSFTSVATTGPIQANTTFINAPTSSGMEILIDKDDNHKVEQTCVGQRVTGLAGYGVFGTSFNNSNEPAIYIDDIITMSEIINNNTHNYYKIKLAFSSGWGNNFAGMSYALPSGSQFRVGFTGTSSLNLPPVADISDEVNNETTISLNKNIVEYLSVGQQIKATGLKDAMIVAINIADTGSNIKVRNQRKNKACVTKSAAANQVATIDNKYYLKIGKLVINSLNKFIGNGFKRNESIQTAQTLNLRYVSDEASLTDEQKNPASGLNSTTIQAGMTMLKASYIKQVYLGKDKANADAVLAKLTPKTTLDQSTKLTTKNRTMIYSVNTDGSYNANAGSNGTSALIENVITSADGLYADLTIINIVKRYQLNSNTYVNLGSADDFKNGFTIKDEASNRVYSTRIKEVSVRSIEEENGSQKLTAGTVITLNIPNDSVNLPSVGDIIYAGSSPFSGPAYIESGSKVTAVTAAVMGVAGSSTPVISYPTIKLDKDLKQSIQVGGILQFTSGNLTTINTTSKATIHSVGAITKSAIAEGDATGARHLQQTAQVYPDITSVNGKAVVGDVDFNPLDSIWLYEKRGDGNGIQTAIGEIETMTQPEKFKLVYNALQSQTGMENYNILHLEYNEQAQITAGTGIVGLESGTTAQATEIFRKSNPDWTAELFIQSAMGENTTDQERISNFSLSKPIGDWYTLDIVPKIGGIVVESSYTEGSPYRKGEIIQFTWFDLQIINNKVTAVPQTNKKILLMIDSIKPGPNGTVFYYCIIPKTNTSNESERNNYPNSVKNGGSYLWEGKAYSARTIFKDDLSGPENQIKLNSWLGTSNTTAVVLSFGFWEGILNDTSLYENKNWFMYPLTYSQPYPNMSITEKRSQNIFNNMPIIKQDFIQQSMEMADTPGNNQITFINTSVEQDRRSLIVPITNMPYELETGITGISTALTVGAGEGYKQKGLSLSDYYYGISGQGPRMSNADGSSTYTGNNADSTVNQ